MTVLVTSVQPESPRQSTEPHDGPGKLRVLVVTESFLPQVNGVTNSVCRVLDHLAAEGHEAMVMAPTGPEEYAGFSVVRSRGAHLPFYGSFRLGLETRRRLRGVMRRFCPDVVHIASPAAFGYQAARVARELGIPSVAIYQTDLIGFAERYHLPGAALAAAAATRAIHDLADLTLAPSSASLHQLADLGVPRCELWPRGVDVTRFHPVLRNEALHARLSEGGDKVVVGFVGRLAAEKELHLLKPLDADPRVQLVLVGSGPAEADLRHRLPNAHFTGALSGRDLGETYASFDVFAHTGRYETFCQAVQEAMASGLPVVAPRAGGPLDLVDEGISGLFFRPGDADSLAQTIEVLLTDEAQRAAMGQAGHLAVRHRSWESVNAALVAHYRRVLDVAASRQAHEDFITTALSGA